MTEQEKREGRREKLKIELPFEDAVRAALQVKPEADPEEKKRPSKKRRP